MDIRIPDCGHFPNCPRCNALVSENVGIEYHEGARQPFGHLINPPCVGLILSCERVPEEVGESLEHHLCKVCRRCGFGWVERAFSTENVYALPPEEDDENEAP